MSPRNATLRPFRLSALLSLRNVSHSELAEQIGVARETVSRWGRHGMDVWQADAAATALGLHPSLVWDQWFNDMGEQCISELSTSASSTSRMHAGTPAPNSP